jgi:Carboxypeptidase regulatory-like domain
LRLYTTLTRRASVLGLFALLAACAPNPNGLGVTDTGTIVGRLVDAKTQQPINSATVSVGTQAVRLSASDAGGFTLTVPIGTQTVDINAIGYAAAHVPVVVHKGQQSCLTDGCVPYGLQPQTSL